MSASIETPPLLARASGATLSEQLARRYAERIGQRLLTPGTRLPSVRECAERHQVSPSTVVGAYDLLQAQGLVEARRIRAPTAAARPASAGAARCARHNLSLIHI